MPLPHAKARTCVADAATNNAASTMLRVFVIVRPPLGHCHAAVVRAYRSAPVDSAVSVTSPHQGLVILPIRALAASSADRRRHIEASAELRLRASSIIHRLAGRCTGTAVVEITPTIAVGIGSRGSKSRLR